MLAKSSDTLSQEAQTESKIILCHKCDYEAEDKYELDANTYTEHDAEHYLICHFWENCFSTKKELMLHRKKISYSESEYLQRFSKRILSIHRQCVLVQT